MHLNKLVMSNFKKFRRAELEFSGRAHRHRGQQRRRQEHHSGGHCLGSLRKQGFEHKKRFHPQCPRRRIRCRGDQALTLSLGKQELVIYRAMKGKGLMPEAFLVLDGQRIATGSKEVDQRLEEILKISYQDFMKTFYARQKDLDNLLKEGGMGKREYLLKLLGLEDIKEYAIELIKSDRASLEEQKSRLAGALAEIGDVEARLEKASQDIASGEKRPGGSREQPGKAGGGRGEEGGRSWRPWPRRCAGMAF